MLKIGIGVGAHRVSYIDVWISGSEGCSLLMRGYCLPANILMVNHEKC